jgi:hypothetical protein
MRDSELSAIKSRWGLARLAGQDAEEAGNGWDDAKIRIFVRSWSDIPILTEEIDKLKAELAKIRRDRYVFDTQPQSWASEFEIVD